MASFDLRLLSTLCDDVVLEILKYLPTNILFGFQHCNDVCLRTLALEPCIVRITDLSQLHLVSARRISAMVSQRTQYLTVLYADNMAYVHPLRFSKVIGKCKFLKDLSLRHSGFSFPVVCKLLRRLNNLEKFSWSTEKAPLLTIQSAVSQATNLGIKKLKKLVIDVHCLNVFSEFLNIFAYHASNLQELELNFYDFDIHSKLENFRRTFSQISSIFKFTELQCLAVSFPSYSGRMKPPFEESCRSIVQLLLEKLYIDQPVGQPWKKLRIRWCLCGNDVEQNVYVDFNSRGLNFCPERSCILINDFDNSIGPRSIVLDQLNDDSVESLGIISGVIDSIVIQKIMRCGSRSLKQFYIPDSAMPCTTMDNSQFLLLMDSCTNITELDIRGVHSTSKQAVSLCEAISHANNLTKLYLSICAVYEDSQNDKPTKIEKIVDRCRCVEEFILSGCYPCGRNPCEGFLIEKGLNKMCRWKHLKNLRIENVNSLKEFNFLKLVGKECHQLTRVQVISLDDSSELFDCLKFLIRNAKSLTYLKIVDKNFDVNSFTFWKAIASAKHLEGLCITTNQAATLDPSIINRFPSKLRNFHFLHLYCTYYNDDLQQSIRSMLRYKMKSRCGRWFVKSSDLIMRRNREQDFPGELACPKEPCCQYMVL